MSRGAPTAIGVLARTVGEPALRRALPLYAGLAVVSAVLFGPTGMSAADVTAIAADSPRFRVGLWLAWLVAIAPATRVSCRADGALYLRALPIPLVVHVGWSAAVALLLQAPWIWLFARGAGWLPALTAGFGAAAAGALIGLGARGWVDQVARLGLLAGLFVALWVDVEPALLAGPAAIVFLLAVPATWVRAPERRSRRDLVRVRGPAPLALGLSAVAHIWRRRRSVLARAVLLAGCGSAMAVLTARSNAVDGAGLATLTVAIAGPALAAALGGVATAIVDHERAARWLLDVTGAGGGLRVAAGVAPMIAVGALAGLLFAAPIFWWAASDAADGVRVISHGLAAGVGWSVIALAAARRCERPSGVDGTLVMALLLGLSLAAALAAALMGEVVSLAVLALAGGGALMAADREDTRRHSPC